MWSLRTTSVSITVEIHVSLVPELVFSMLVRSSHRYWRQGLFLCSVPYVYALQHTYSRVRLFQIQVDLSRFNFSPHFQIFLRHERLSAPASSSKEVSQSCLRPRQPLGGASQRSVILSTITRRDGFATDPFAASEMLWSAFLATH